MHTRALRLEEEEQARAENRKIRVTVPPSSENSPITAAVSNMGRLGKEERSSILRLFDIAYLIAFKGCPYSDFTDIIELEKLHGVTFFSNSVYENDMGCKIFIHFAAKALFEKEVKDKIKRANFITVLADGATDAALIEKEVVYVLFVDPDEFKPALEFLSLKSVASQDAQGITSAIVDAFQDCDISEKLKRIVFFESDGTSVNSGLRGGVISLLQQRYGKHIKFFWCLSHRIELGLKDALKKDMEEEDTAMRDLYYIYQNSGKRLRELRSLHEILKDGYSFENGEVKPSKSMGTRWIDHKLRAMKAFIDKSGLYLSHMQNVIADTSKKNDKATLEGKRRRIAQGSVLLKCAMYVDILEPARQLSLVSQSTNEINIIQQVEKVESTLKQYQIMQRRVQETDAVATSALPTDKHVLSVIEKEGPSNVGQQSRYQGVPVSNVEQSKAAINCLVRCNVNAINESLANRYGSLADGTEAESSKTQEADELAHAVVKVLNTRVWMKDATEESLTSQLNAISKVVNAFKELQPLRLTNEEKLKDQYVMLVQWATTYFAVEVINPMELWPRLRKVKHNEAKELWVLIELCLCCPYGNAVCESFISYLRVVKTDWRSRLNESNLSDLLRIKVTGPTVTDFHDSFSELAIELWSEAKRRRPNQGKRKKYLPRNEGKKRTRAMERVEFLEEWLADIGGNTESGSDDDDQDEEAEEVDTTLLIDVDEVASLPQEETTVTQTESHSDSSAEETEWSDDPFDCGMRSSDSASD